MEKLAVINMARTGRNIAALRLQQGISVRALQQVFGFATPQAIYKWQNGVSLPTVDNLVIFSAVFHVPIDTVFRPRMNNPWAKGKFRGIMKCAEVTSAAEANFRR